MQRAGSFIRAGSFSEVIALENESRLSTLNVEACNTLYTLDQIFAPTEKVWKPEAYFENPLFQGSSEGDMFQQDSEERPPLGRKSLGRKLLALLGKSQSAEEGGAFKTKDLEHKGSHTSMRNSRLSFRRREPSTLSTSSNGRRSSFKGHRGDSSDSGPTPRNSNLNQVADQNSVRRSMGRLLSRRFETV